MDNSHGYAESYREVIHEDRVKVSGQTKAPDYSFRLSGGKRLFFVEAKKPSVVVKDDLLPAYQVRRYGWSAKLPVSIVTDFEEFALYDCTKKPFATDKASAARIKYLTYKDYSGEFDFLWDTFSKERVLKGGLDKFIATSTLKKGTTTVDKEFLSSLDEWRKELALNIALRNDVSNDELNFVVQALLDRLIFLRIAEDRSVEEYGALKQCIRSIGGEKNIVYTRLLKLFAEADSKYNSGIFDFRQDKISQRLEIDNVTLRRIIQHLYYPDSPYEFSVLNVEILGSAYEQFLGKQIILKSAHRAVIEEKPEVRKAGGVYYTPQYIVEYIVANTMGTKIKELEKTFDVSKTAQVSAIAKLKIADPACGSGSFLLGAYEYLLRWHREYYMPEFERLTAIAASSEYNTKQRNDAVRERNKLPLTPTGNLTTALKKQILLNNIYGVDLDINAVEVTKLSLLLKCMEGETQSSINAELRFSERVLPSLENNIRCGNSLIDLDYYDGTEDVDEKIKPFNWQRAFPEAYKIRKPASNQELKYHLEKVKKLQQEAENLIEKLSNKVEEPEVVYSELKGFDVIIGNPPYRLMQPKDTDQNILDYFKRNYNVAEFKIDLFHLFLQQGIKLLRKNGLLGYITPSSLLNNVYVENLRGWLLDNCRLDTIALTKEKVFADADVFTSVFILEKDDNKKYTNKNLIKTTTELEKVKLGEEIKYSFVLQERFKTANGKIWNILINETNVKILEKIKADTKSLNERALINRGLITGDRSKYFSSENISNKYVPILSGSDVFRYYTNQPSEYVLFERPKTSGGCWDREVHFAEHKILIRQIGFSPTASLLTEPIAVTGNIFTLRSQSLTEEKYILGIINSKLIAYFWKIMFSDFKSSFPQVTIFSLNSIPIKITKEDDLKNQVIRSVDIMLQLNKQLQETTLPLQQEQLKQRMAFTDKKIDELVYELYGVREEEIKVVEGEVK